MKKATSPEAVPALLAYGREILLSAAAVLGFTSLILLIAGAPPLSAYYHIFNGSLGSWVKVGHVIKVWIPLTLCACGLLYTFRIDLWNIGVEGQVMMGAIFTTGMLRFGVSMDAPLVVLTASLIAGGVGGALWALLAGYLRANAGVNEIFAGLGLNFVAQGMTLWLIFGPWRRPGVASMSGTEILPQKLWLPYSESLRLSPLSFFLVWAAIVATALMLRYTRFGLYLKAIGRNPAAASLFGLNPGRYMLLAMVFAGGLAGLAGSLQVSGVSHRLLPAISSNYGYLALLVVMLANYNVWMAPAVAFFFACLNVGSIQLPMMLQLDSSLAGVIQGALVLATMAIHFGRGSKAVKKQLPPGDDKCTRADPWKG
jgi:simple sugar transport system permease protein